jgi:hypothetical protein
MEQAKKEALFNEVKGSLFEFLVGKFLAQKSGEEALFVQTIDRNYLHVLSQQDRMVRQFYPEMQTFLQAVSLTTGQKILDFFTDKPHNIKLLGKFVSQTVAHHEADISLEVQDKTIPVSLKLNKKNAFVNTKSGGIKSFFSHYFPFLDEKRQEQFNQFVDLEFNRMAIELHSFHDLEFVGNFKQWVSRGHSELPGELSSEEREILKAYYARIARRMHELLSEALKKDKKQFAASLLPLLGFSANDILQVVCFHDFKKGNDVTIDIHPFAQAMEQLSSIKINPFHDLSSVDISVGGWSLQIRVKPMNKFTTTAIKINCSVKYV